MEDKGGPEEDRGGGNDGLTGLSTLTADTPGQLDVLGHDGHALGMDGAQVGILEQSNEVSLAGLLQSHHGRALEAQVSLEILSDFAHQTLERQLADEQFSGLLVATDLTKSHRSRPVAMRLLHATGGRGTLAGSLRGQLLPRGLASSRLTSSLLGTSHDNVQVRRISLVAFTAAQRTMLMP